MKNKLPYKLQLLPVVYWKLSTALLAMFATVENGEIFEI